MAYLITTAGTRIPLRDGQGYVLGRGRECDIVVEDLACSRRHALLTVDETGLRGCVEDLGSRNGTFLNGERVAIQVPLRQGARIRIGAAVFLVHLMDASEVDLVDTGTVAFEHPAMAMGSDLDGGELAQYGLVELLKLLMQSKRSLSLHVALPDDNAQIELRAGEILAASCGGLDGFNALVKLGRAPNGIFWVVRCEHEIDRNVKESAGHLLVELSRCLGSGTPSA